MDRLIYVAMSGASQTMARQAAVAQNLANVSSTGYRAEEHRLRAAQVMAATPGALPTRAFTVDASTHSNLASGPMQSTGRSLDVAVQGAGWIAVTLADGSEGYTRDGSLQLDVNGVLQTRAGLTIQGDGGAISIPPDQKVSIGTDGTVSVVPESGAQNTVNTIGRIKLVNPPEETLVRGDDGFFRIADGSAAAIDDNVKLAEGTLEGSNVSPVEQMVSMISLGRQFEMQMKMLTSAEANDRAASDIIIAR
jgi:flagellar basal-body rod protein FlgF